MVFLEHAYVKYFIAGILPDLSVSDSLPPWATCVLDSEAKHAVETAVSVVRRKNPIGEQRSLFCFPLVVSDGKVGISGASLGLPLAIAFTRLLSGEKMPPGLAATGRITEDGVVLPVGALDEKCACSSNRGMRVLLYPSGNQAPRRCGDLETLPVENLDQAAVCADLHAPGRGGDLLVFLRMLDDAVSCVHHCGNVPRQWLVWAHAQGRMSDTMRRMVRSSELFEKFVCTFEECLNKGALDHCETLSELAREEVHGHVADMSPITVFKWCTLNMACANHRGRLQEANGWDSMAQRCVDRARESDVRAFAAYHNHRFVALHHNRYRFAPELPKYLTKIIDALGCPIQGRTADRGKSGPGSRWTLRVHHTDLRVLRPRLPRHHRTLRSPGPACLRRRGAPGHER